MKTNKSFTKRLKITRNGKIKARTKGQNHFNAKASRRKQATKRRKVDFVITNKSASRYLIHY